ncbi:MAG TPA: type 4a pilus biogenesis protein PilO [Candidatus Rubrimentiphilum sp.]|nr:type 4a pilus biogenesis protein PilO [Candidatus Rubrimentiphilum sp.]
MWLLAVFVFVFGVRAIASHESAIAKASVATEELTRRIESNYRTLAQAETLRRREQLAWDDLLKISGGQQPAISVAEFLRRLKDMAWRRRLSVVSIIPGDESTPSKPASRALAPLPITILVRGKFRSLVRFIQEITRQRTLTGVESVKLMLSSIPSARTAGLDATIHVTLYRVIVDAANVPAN